MRTPSFSQRIVFILGLGVALPALVLAALGVFLTLRISDAVESQSIRYNHYMAQQVVEGFEQELLAHLREAVAGAEIEARNGSSPGRSRTRFRRGPVSSGAPSSSHSRASPTTCSWSSSRSRSSTDPTRAVRIARATPA